MQIKRLKLRWIDFLNCRFHTSKCLPLHPRVRIGNLSRTDIVDEIFFDRGWLSHREIVGNPREHHDYAVATVQSRTESDRKPAAQPEKSLSEQSHQRQIRRDRRSRHRGLATLRSRQKPHQKPLHRSLHEYRYFRLKSVLNNQNLTAKLKNKTLNDFFSFDELRWNVRDQVFVDGSHNQADLTWEIQDERVLIIPKKKSVSEKSE